MYELQMANTPRDKVPQLHDADVLRLLEQQSSTDFPPGSRWEYSNSGYAVLASIVERVSGEPFERFLAQRIFAPVGMTHTLAYVKGGNEVSHRAFGYRKNGSGEGWMFSDQSPTSAVLGDGGIYSSIGDLAKWDKALADHRLLTDAEMRPAITPVEVEGGVRLPDGSLSQYGFGWFLDPYKGHRRMWHYGDTSGFHTFIERLLDDKLTVIVIANRTDVDPRELASKVADLYLHHPHSVAE
jgi:CubicO group peptidase (beta-lactamase class C family)